MRDLAVYTQSKFTKKVITFEVDYEMDLNMSQEDFENMPWDDQFSLLQNYIHYPHMEVFGFGGKANLKNPNNIVFQILKN